MHSHKSQVLKACHHFVNNYFVLCFYFAKQGRMKVSIVFMNSSSYSTKLKCIHRILTPHALRRHFGVIASACARVEHLGNFGNLRIPGLYCIRGIVLKWQTILTLNRKELEKQRIETLCCLCRGTHTSLFFFTISMQCQFLEII